MGVGASKVDNLPLVSLCRKRKEFIRAAVNSRYDLATAHILYFQSLLDVGNALNRFVEEELEIIVDPSHEEPSSDEDSHLKFPSTDSDSELGSQTDYVHDDSKLSNGHNLSMSRNQGRAKVNSNIHYMTRSSSEMSSTMYEQPGVIPMTKQEQDWPNYFSSYPQYWNGASSSASTSGWPNDDSYAQGNNRVWPVDATIGTAQNNVRNPQHGSDQSFRDSMKFLPNDPRLHQHGNRESFGVSFGAHHDYAYYSEKQSALAASSPASPIPGVFSWDHLDLFNMFDNVYFNYYYQDRYETGSSDFREVKEREGIPDLEDESEQKSVEEVSIERKPEEEIMEGPGDGDPKTAPSKNDEDLQQFQEKEMKGEPANVEEDMKGSTETSVLTSSEDNHAKKDGVSSESDHPFTQEDDSLGSISLTTSDTCGSRGLPEVVKEIRDAFETAFNHGKEVSVLLEAGKLPYQPMGPKFKEFASWILGWIPSMVTSSRRSTHMLLNQSASRRLLMVKAIDGIIEENICRKFGDISSTLELMYVWEKKLYEEVMVEEKLRAIYDKECKMLKSLDDRGADSSKIDNVHASIKRSLLKINVSVTAVDVISRRIHRLRDEELHLQLIELIEGLMRMWRFLAKCHLKQFRAIIGTKACVHIARADIRKDSSLKATQKLEKEILNWGTCFCNYIDAQKAFVKFLNEWLMRCIFQDPEDTVDGSGPLSPSRIGAPPVFTVCSDWYHAIEGVSEIGVCKAIHTSASKLHHLHEMLVEELNQRLKTEHLSKDLEKHLRTFSEDGGMHCHQDVPLCSIGASECPKESGAPLVGGLNEELISMRKRLDEQKARHEEVVKQVNDAASTCLQECLVPIFEALEKFYVENLNAYEHVIIPNRGQSI